MQAVTLPILDANMTHGVIRAWMKGEGDAVQAGELLFEVETDKINAVVEAEVTGIVRRIVVPVGERAAVLDVLAFIGAAHEEVPSPQAWLAAAVAPTPPAVEPLASAAPSVAAPAVPIRTAASPAARRLARERGVALESLRGTGARGEITTADVEAATTEVFSPGTTSDGRLEPGFLDELRRDAAAFRALSSELKVRLYREHGARIGAHVRIENGAILLAEEIDLGDGVTIGADSIVKCDRLHLGPLAAFGQRTSVHCRSVEIGAALWSKDDVVIGGGGSDEAGARLHAGDACFFGEAAYLNPCHPITLGDEVCIGSRAMLFTHSHWQSVLRGYRSLFGPIHIGDHVFIGNQAFVFPGVTVGEGATVIVNSFVAMNVAPSTMVGGVPAQVMRHIAPPSATEQLMLATDQLMPELAQALADRGFAVQRSARDGGVDLDLGDAGTVCFLPEWSVPPRPVRRLVVLTFAGPERLAVPAGATVFDLRAGRVHGEQDALSDEVREFCRRRGLRFRPYAWRYRVGHCDGERLVPR